MREIAMSPESHGTIVIHGVKGKPFSSYEHKLLLTGYIRIRQFEVGRIAFVRGDDEERLRVQFLKFPAGTSLPAAETKEWDYKLPDIITHVILYKKSWINEECPETFSHDFFSKFLEANSHLGGQLKIFVRSKEEFKKTRNELLHRLVGKDKVAVNRLIFTHVKSKKSEIEYWYLRDNEREYQSELDSWWVTDVAGVSLGFRYARGWAIR